MKTLLQDLPILLEAKWCCTECLIAESYSYDFKDGNLFYFYNLFPVQQCLLNALLLTEIDQTQSQCQRFLQNLKTKHSTQCGNIKQEFPPEGTSGQNKVCCFLLPSRTELIS